MVTSLIGREITFDELTEYAVNVLAERGDKQELGRMLQLVLGCAVNCDDKDEYIRCIMSMEEAVQHDVMKAIQEVRHCCAVFVLQMCS